MVFFEIEALPVHCNLLWSNRETALNAPRGNIRLGFCSTCGLIYNVSFDSRAMQYSSGYETSLHFSAHFRAYAQELAARLIKDYDLRGKDIIEIGCGQGEFLCLLCEGGRNRGLGFDPSYDSRKADMERTSHIRFIQDFYPEKYSDYEADFICCRHLLEHIECSRDFLSQVRRTIGKRDTVVFFEVPNVLYTLRDLGIWDVIYEHCSYFSPSSLSRLFTETGFKVLKLYEAYGGQFLCIEAVPVRAGAHPPAGQPEDMSEVRHLVPAFADNHRKKVEGWYQDLANIVRSGRRAVVWGAGSKGVTFLNTLKGQGQIEYVVDMNTRKQGLYVAGTGQQIVPPEMLRDYRPDVIIVMNPIYRGEIRHMVQRMGVAAELMAA